MDYPNAPHTVEGSQTEGVPISSAPTSQIAIRPDDVLITPLEYERRFKVSRATQCRRRKSGDSPPYVVDCGKILYPLSAVIEWMNTKLVHPRQSDRTPSESLRYKHLASARAKALEARRKSKEGVI